MRKIRRVVIREIDGEFEMATTFGGLYNRIRSFPDEKSAREYAEEKGYRCRKVPYNGSPFVNG